jgi:hypothetical protein
MTTDRRTPRADALEAAPQPPPRGRRPAGGWFTAIGRSYRAEAGKLRRPGTVAAVAALALLAVLSGVLSFALAKSAPAGAVRLPELALPTLSDLAAPEGLTLGFRVGSTFTGLLLLVLCAATTAAEHSQGTIRVIFLRQPRRLAWLAGRTGALLSLLALALVGAFVLGAATAVLMAEIRGVPTGQWWTGAALRDAGRDYGNVLLSTTCYALTGTTLGLVIRSTTAAVLVGVAWMFPLEHIVQQAWLDAVKWLPGLVFSDIATGGNPVSGYRDPLILGVAYAALFTVAGVASLARRDVTA